MLRVPYFVLHRQKERNFMNFENDKMALPSMFEWIKDGLTDKYVFYTSIQQKNFSRLHHYFWF